MDNQMQEKLQQLLENKEYMEHLLSLGSAEEISKELEKEDIDLSPEELRKIYALAKKKEAGELSDAELEEVAGGFSIGLILAIMSIVAAAAPAVGYGLRQATKKC